MSKQKDILVLGARGLLGSMVLHVLIEAGLTARGTSRSGDAGTLPYSVDEGVEGLDRYCAPGSGVGYIVNCIGITNAEIDERDVLSVTRAMRVNSIFPRELACYAEEGGVRVIHISTDGVFSTNAGTCDEDASHECADVYGKTKSLGEAPTPNSLVIRCSIVGPSPFKGGGFLGWFLSVPEGSVIDGYANHTWNGVTTLQYAALCCAIIEGGCFDEIVAESPVHHFCPNKPTTKYEMLNVFSRVFERNVTVRERMADRMVNRLLSTKYESMSRIMGVGGDFEKAVTDMRSYVAADRGRGCGKEGEKYG